MIVLMTITEFLADKRLGNLPQGKHEPLVVKKRMENSQVSLG